MGDPHGLPDPPGPPAIERRVRLYAAQWIGIPLLVLVPVLAGLGVFGLRVDEARARAAALELNVEHPSRLRHKQTGDIHVRVRNLADRPRAGVVVSLDSAYLDRFANLAFSPDVTRAYEVELPALGPGEDGLVRVQLQAERAGRHAGDVRVVAGGAELARARLHTLVFP